MSKPRRSLLRTFLGAIVVALLCGAWGGMWLDWKDRADREQHAIYSCLQSRSGTHVAAVKYCSRHWQGFLK